jgi:acyl carrier protein
MISPRLKRAILDELGLNDFAFEETTRASDVPGWDSLRHVSVILAVEREFGVRLGMAEVLGLKTVADLQLLLDRKLASRSAG